MAYGHGVYISEVATSILPPVETSAGLPVVFGTAPVHLTENPSANLNKPVLCYSYADAVAEFGYVPADETTGKFEFTISEFMSSHFALFAVAPVVFVNVLDPATHVAAVLAEEVTLVSDEATPANVGVLQSTVVVKSSDGQTTYVNDTDYALTYKTNGDLVITRLDGGTMTAGSTLQIDYSYLDTSAVTSADIIGGVNGTTGAYTGLELINEIFPRFRLVPGQIVAPKYSADSAVATVMKAKSRNINNHFKAMSLIDVPTGEVTKYTDVAAWKNDNNVMDAGQVACWPKLSLGGVQYHLSSQLASLICLTDSNNSDIPYVSPSNKSLQADSTVLEDGSEVWLSPDTAAYLNGQGVITALNFIGGWKAWGNRTAVYPASTDPKDSFLPVRRMFDWVGNTITLTYWQRLDYPLNPRQIQTITDSVNIWLNGLTSQGYILGGRVEFREDENPTTSLIDGIAKFHVYLTPPSPNREIDFVLEYDPAYLSSLFA